MAKIKRTNLTKNDMKHLPNTNGDNFKEQCAYYTELVFTKHNKTESFRIAFPDKYQQAIDRAGGNNNVVNANIKKAINQVENSKFMQECFTVANKHWWMKFIGKKQQVLEKLYDDAISDELDIRDRHNASKLFMSYVPDAPKEEKVTVEVKVGSDEFKNMLLEKKRLLHSTANNEEIIDAEVN